MDSITIIDEDRICQLALLLLLLYICVGHLRQHICALIRSVFASKLKYSIRRKKWYSAGRSRESLQLIWSLHQSLSKYLIYLLCSKCDIPSVTLMKTHRQIWPSWLFKAISLRCLRVFVLRGCFWELQLRCEYPSTQVLKRWREPEVRRSWEIHPGEARLCEGTVRFKWTVTPPAFITHVISPLLTREFNSKLDCATVEQTLRTRRLIVEDAHFYRTCCQDLCTKSVLSF